MTDYRKMPRQTNSSRLAQVRNERGITQAQLAEQLGVSQQQITRWERKLPKVDTLKRIGHILNIDWKSLVD